MNQKVTRCDLEERVDVRGRSGRIQRGLGEGRWTVAVAGRMNRVDVGVGAPSVLTEVVVAWTASRGEVP